MLKQFEVQKNIIATFDLNGVTFNEAMNDIDNALRYRAETNRDVYPTSWGSMRITTGVKRGDKQHYGVLCERRRKCDIKL